MNRWFACWSLLVLLALTACGRKVPTVDEKFRSRSEEHNV